MVTIHHKITFLAHHTGTNVSLEPGAYNVTEQGLDPVTPAICSTMGFEAGSSLRK